MFLHTVLFSASIISTCIASSPLRILYEWSSIDYIYDDSSRRESDLNAGKLKPQDVIILDSDVYKDTVFVTTPSLLLGVPFTLSTVSSKNGSGGPLLNPFPSPSWHYFTGDCDNTIISVWRIKIDKLGRLWVIDCGRINHLVKSEVICPEKLFVFDLNNNNQLLKKYIVPTSQLGGDSKLINVEVEILDDAGSESFAYLADNSGFRLVVYDYAQDRSYSIRHPYFFPDPMYGFYNVNDAKFTLMDGIFPFSLGPTDRNGERNLYFHAFSAGREGYVSTNVLRSATLSQNFSLYQIYPYNKRFHACVEIINKDGYMIFSDVEDNALIGWDINTYYTYSNFKVLAQDKKKLQFPTGIKIINEDTLVVTTSRFQNVLNRTIARNEINYRIVVASLSQLIP